MDELNTTPEGGEAAPEEVVTPEGADEVTETEGAEAETEAA